MRQSEERYIRISDKNSNKKIFTKLFDAAAIARFSPTELREYEDSLKAYRDIKNSLDTAKEEGRAEGREEGRAEGREEGRAEGIAMVTKMMFAKGMDIDVMLFFFIRRHTSVRRRRQSSSRVCMRYGARADDSCIWSGAK